MRSPSPTSVRDGGLPLVTTDDATTAMRAMLAIAAGVDGPDLPLAEDGIATVTAQWDPEQVADHTGVTATFGAPLAPTRTVVPDALVGKCWPAVFAAVGSAATDTGIPVVEGLLNLVHLDHAAQLLAPPPKTATELLITATAGIVTDTEVGRVVPVSVTIADCGRHRAGQAAGTLRDPRPHRHRRTRRPSAGRRSGVRQCHRHSAPAPPRREADRTDRHAAVRRGFR